MRLRWRDRWIPRPRRDGAARRAEGPSQVAKLARSMHRALELFFRFGGLACVPCVHGVFDHGPEWLPERLLRRRKHSACGA